MNLHFHGSDLINGLWQAASLSASVFTICRMGIILFTITYLSYRDVYKEHNTWSTLSTVEILKHVSHVCQTQSSQKCEYPAVPTFDPTLSGCPCWTRPLSAGVSFSVAQEAGYWNPPALHPTLQKHRREGLLATMSVTGENQWMRQKHTQLGCDLFRQLVALQVHADNSIGKGQLSRQGSLCTEGGHITFTLK